MTQQERSLSPSTRLSEQYIVPLLIDISSDPAAKMIYPPQVFQPLSLV